MQRLTVDHQAGRLGRDAVLADADGRAVLRLAGDWAVTDADRRSVLFLGPDYGGIVRAAVIDGIIGGILGTSGTGTVHGRNAGPGRETVKRAVTPVRGIPPRWTPVATVVRQPAAPANPTAYAVEMHEALPPVAIVQRLDAAALRDVDNGYADRREGVFDLDHADGRPILRHWATIDGKLRLRSSTFDVEDPDFPIGEAVMLCLARFRAWQS